MSLNQNVFFLIFYANELISILNGEPPWSLYALVTLFMLFLSPVSFLNMLYKCFLQYIKIYIEFLDENFRELLCWNQNLFSMVASLKHNRKGNKKILVTVGMTTGCQGNHSYCYATGSWSWHNLWVYMG